MKHKKIFLSYFAILLVLIISIAGISQGYHEAATKSNTASYSSQNVVVEQLKVEPQVLHLSNQASTVLQASQKPMDYTVFTGIHPSVSLSGSFDVCAAYKDQARGNIVWTYSEYFGQIFESGTYFDVGGDYPCIKNWNDSTFWGTFVTDSTDNNGGVIYLFKTTDLTDIDTYELTRWDFSNSGFFDMIAADIACCNNQNESKWGLCSYVMSTTYYEENTACPTLIFPWPWGGGIGIAWYEINGCEHTSIDIDSHTNMTYAVYDWYNETAHTWQLLVRVIDSINPYDGYDELFLIKGNGDLKNPKVSVNNGNLIIVAEEQIDSNKDIVCYYSHNSDLQNMQRSTIATSTDDEQYPNIEYMQEEKFIVTYVLNNTLYGSITRDAGESWSHPSWRINDNDGAVVEEYATSDLCDKCYFSVWQKEAEDTQIVLDYIIVYEAPNIPQIDGPSTGCRGTEYEWSFVSDDPQAEDLYYYIDWGDGTNEQRIGPYLHGRTVTVAHTYRKLGTQTYTIKAKAEGLYSGLQSDWATLETTMPYSKHIAPTLQQTLAHLLEAIGLEHTFVWILKELFIP